MTGGDLSADCVDLQQAGESPGHESDHQVSLHRGHRHSDHQHGCHQTGQSWIFHHIVNVQTIYNHFPAFFLFRNAKLDSLSRTQELY